jgi:hypothetical protein
MKKLLVVAAVAVCGLMVAGSQTAQAHDQFVNRGGYGYQQPGFNGVSFGGNGFNVTIGSAQPGFVGRPGYGYGNPVYRNPGYNTGINPAYGNVGPVYGGGYGRGHHGGYGAGHGVGYGYGNGYGNNYGGGFGGGFGSGYGQGRGSNHCGW